ncbi:hypothetical protein AB0K51_33405, partial [Kitasatospora sp. NPDC049285]
PAPGPAPAAPRPRRRRRVLAVLVAVLLVGGAAGGGAYLATHHTPNRGGTGQPDGGDTAAPATESAAPTGQVPSGGPAPAGYVWQDDPDGYRFLLPTTDGTWTRVEEGGQVYYSPDARVHYLQFAVTVGQPLTPLQHFEEMELSVSKNLKEYQSTGPVAARINDREGAVWEFSYTAKDGTRRHAKEAEFRNTDGTSYAVYVSGPEKDWVQSLRRFTTVLNNFTPKR